MFGFFRNSKGKFLICLAVIILLIFLHYLRIIRPLEDFTFLISKNINSFFYPTTVKVTNFFDLLFSIRDLQKDNKNLEEKNYTLIAENIKLQEFKKENDFLRNELNFTQKREIRGIEADLISTNTDNLRQTILINRGEKDGIRAGAPIIFSNGFLVGRVIETYYYTAKILLITDKDSVVNAMIVDSEATGNVAGRHGVGLVIDMIPQTEVVNINDEVVTSGLSGDYPKGLLIGEIVKVESTSGELFQKAQIKPYVNFFKLNRVFVITNFVNGVIL